MTEATMDQVRRFEYIAAEGEGFLVAIGDKWHSDGTSVQAEKRPMLVISTEGGRVTSVVLTSCPPPASGGANPLDDWDKFVAFVNAANGVLEEHRKDA